MRWELMDRYLAGKCGQAEIEEIECWLAQAPARRRVLEQLAGPGDAEVMAARASIWAKLEQEVGPPTGS